MRCIEDIFHDTRVQELEQIEPHFFGGLLRLRSGKQRVFTVMVSTCEEGSEEKYEHVSVSLYGDRYKTPTWEEMCEVKDIFWTEEEEVHQIHPKKSEYIHGVGDKTNILHLWRPVNGWGAW